MSEATTVAQLQQAAAAATAAAESAKQRLAMAGITGAGVEVVKAAKKEAKAAKKAAKKASKALAKAQKRAAKHAAKHDPQVSGSGLTMPCAQRSRPKVLVPSLCCPPLAWHQLQRRQRPGHHSRHQVTSTRLGSALRESLAKAASLLVPLEGWL